MRLPARIIALCMLAATAAPAPGASEKDHSDCDAEDPDRNIAGCTRIAEDPAEGETVRAIAYVGRGLAWQRKGNRDAALADFTEAIRINPRDSLAYSDRGVLWREKGDVDRAIADFTRAIELNPKPRSDVPGVNHVNVYTNRGLAWQAKGDLDRALSDFDEAIVLDPRDADACFFRAQIYIAKHDLRNAVADLDAAIRLDPRRTNAWYLRGAVRYDRYMFANAYVDPRDLEGAIADYTEVIRREPELVNAYYARARAFSTNGERDRAVADLIRAAEINPFNPAVIAALKLLKPDYQLPKNPVADWLEQSESASGR